MNNNNWGGRRANQNGRPSIPEQDQRQQFSTRLPLWILLWLRRQGRSQGKLIEEALVNYYKLVEGENE